MHGTLKMILEWVGKTEIVSWVEYACRMCMCVCVHTYVACLYALGGPCVCMWVVCKDMEWCVCRKW